MGPRELLAESALLRDEAHGNLQELDKSMVAFEAILHDMASEVAAAAEEIAEQLAAALRK